MTSLFASGLAFAIIALLMLAEFAALALFHRRTGRGISPKSLIGDIGAGTALLVAAIATLRHAPWPAIAAALLLALAAHLFDVAQRWKP